MYPIFKTDCQDVIINEDGALVLIIREWLNKDEAMNLMFQLIKEADWQRLTIEYAGREILQPRLSAWAGELGVLHGYSRVSNGGGLQMSGFNEPWEKKIKDLMDKIILQINTNPKLTNCLHTLNLFGEREICEIISDYSSVENPALFNACLLNRYQPGNYIGAHSDREVAPPHYAVVSISLGSSCRFKFTHRNKPEQRETWLHNGDLCVMWGQCQNLWKHEIPKSSFKYGQERISLTFRQLMKKTYTGSEMMKSLLK